MSRGSLEFIQGCHEAAALQVRLIVRCGRPVVKAYASMSSTRCFPLGDRTYRRSLPCLSFNIVDSKTTFSMDMGFEIWILL